MIPVDRADLIALTAERTSTGEAVQFWVLGAVAVLGALGVVTATKAVYSAIFLATTMIVLAVFYVAQGALFLGVVQVVVYTGAVMMLFLFVLMLIGVDSSDSLRETLRGQRTAALLIAAGFATLLCAGIANATVVATGGATPPVPGAAGAGVGSVEEIARLIFVEYLWAFELTGALLITATLGAVVLAHRERFGPRPTQREVSIERFRRGGQATPLPNPGVYARHNSADTPARLPDGSPAELSVPGTVITRRTGTRTDVSTPPDIRQVRP
ncbi:NADH-quinone oxidoreductase subunit J [Gordonia pseudamarae]|jgi:NADH-quinone oxidoreductase subunit J|uniref:NADH-quinone oxidoreductase subunit J n=1 Tax=Gordonia pseudamarae TaxID=2831662 RepID=A0ABX6IMC7_9ACTN|nr:MULTISPECIES: NADH-quinone oxidoreductase subunit J [Gordonia]MBD0023828.1 NADH-quinone oxidoreductase subunit J [Gordonia sp. (in: high G+C Gram-positive bacteria)]QHN28131.1 NADH-quinone oxidoreductase subunit J [Gordonia pseudamarae]QHN36994.1 NADH-quinone oxidoreductase subunit J [Gordonia pseudamarae]